MKKILISCLIVILLFIAGCVQEPDAKKQTVVTTAKECPESCDDNDDCTEDHCSEDTNFECKHKLILPCCGNDKCESKETYKSCPSDCKTIVDANEELVELLKKSEELEGYKYFYSDGEDLFMDVWVKGNLIKEEFHSTTTKDYFDTIHDTVILDTEKKTAYSYSTERLCDDYLIARDADYNKFKVETPLEFAEKIALNAKSVGGETMDNRKVLVFEYEDEGATVKVWIIEYYGMPTKVEITKNGEKKRIDYDEMAFKVKDSDFADPDDLQFVD
jgi:outer membrane lipoprotein-sorting protein